MSEMRKLTINITILILLIAILVAITPKLLGINAEWSGADVQGKDAISEINPDYEPWFSPIWEPPSGEIESLLFALQAAIGAGIIGYIAGYWSGQKKQR